MSIKNLQNNFTTPEQSKRLLELGVPANSADCYFGSYPGHPDCAVIRQSEFDTEGDALFRLNEDIIPCWSVGRLMEIIRICNLTAEKPWVYIERDNIHAMITAITDGVNNHMLDLSKLED